MIIITTQCFSPKIGGIEALMTGMAESLAAAGKEVLVLADGKKNLDLHSKSQYSIKDFMDGNLYGELEKQNILKKFVKKNMLRLYMQIHGKVLNTSIRKIRKS